MNIRWLIPLLVLAAMVSIGAAHPPSDLILAYNSSSNELQVTFTHLVENPTSHYIREVDVEVVGGDQILQRQYIPAHRGHFYL
jgi:hypothetical protein